MGGAVARLASPADVAQLVEHFTRNEGVPGSSPGVGFPAKPLLRCEFVVSGGSRGLRFTAVCVL